MSKQVVSEARGIQPTVDRVFRQDQVLMIGSSMSQRGLLTLSVAARYGAAALDAAGAVTGPIVRCDTKAVVVQRRLW